MDKNHLYFNYLRDDSNYYVKRNPSKDTGEYIVDGFPTNCRVVNEDGSPWKFYGYEDKKIKEQGWKIHISATMANAKDILEVVSGVLFEREIPFKHLLDRKTLHSVNSKNGNRISSGKFITIYPATDNEFLELLDVLYEKLKDYENGPYILSDKCWKNSNIYYRYGAFNSIYNEKGELCIRDEAGHLIPDHRKPFYQAPEFVKDFDQLLDSRNQVTEDKEGKNKLGKYDFQRVLRFSNGGGIYFAERKLDKRKVVIREARPKVGLDGNDKDAIERLEIEYNALAELDEVEGVVDVIDYFQSWKHSFLVEEYVDGFDLQKWIAMKYPFHNGNDKETYITDVKKIMNQLIDTVSQMHRKKIGMGDLQPSNIIITPDLCIKLIDFESAAPKDSKVKAAMQTIGFANMKNESHQERDWYAVKKILRYCVLPIGAINNIDESVISYQNQWISREFGEDVYLYVKEIENLCDQYLPVTNEKNFPLMRQFKEDKTEEINVIIEQLRKGMINNIVPDSGLIHGDIRQHEMSNGKWNVLTGGTGAVLALHRTGNLPKEAKDWVENNLIEQMYTNEQGLFTGKAGIAATLYELGYKEDSLTLFDEFLDNLNHEDISLRSGLSGIGLAVISLYLEEDNQIYLEKAEFIASHIKTLIRNNQQLTVTDWAAVPIGIMDGWSGASLFYSAMYAITNNKDYYEMSKELIEKDLANTQTDEDTNILQTFDDRRRLLPYLSGGTIGIGIAIWYLNEVSNQNLYHEQLKQIINLNELRCTFSGGLFDGAGGFLLLSALMKEQPEKLEKSIKQSMNRLDLFLIRKEDQILFPGNFCYRLSDDVYSGSSGILLALKGIVDLNPLFWLPIINSNDFITRTLGFAREPIGNT
ncbi:Lanthionine synthetase C-like protein [Oceanobacillus limi]|uniref:Lanthionine synthetase C-like protein n=1 Tax=Oceanobacillus limi TaxID=930131 RepID=A0A1I0ESV4_9BACI|nr:class III lanthionine synthetase LanKC [Oceanobacillus limi]SET47921.1 Lanthionine synthetase C-like protein [Oceanobacillus limi]